MSWMTQQEQDYGYGSPVVFDVDRRMTGKTTRMLDWMNAAPEGETRVYVTFSVAAARVAWDWSRREGVPLEKWQFVTLQQIENGALHGRPGRIVLGIDNLELLLGRLFRNDVGRVAATGIAEHHIRAGVAAA